MPSASAAPALPFFWCPDAKPDDKDAYVAFRAEFDLPTATNVEFVLFGATWFVGALDGRAFCEGPARFPKKFPEYQTARESLASGRHALSFVVNHIGVSTRLLEVIEPFLACVARVDGREISLAWKCHRLTAYAPAVRRLNPQLGFIEWCDTRALPAGWQLPGFDATGWLDPVAVTRDLGPLQPLSSANTLSLTHPLTPLATGTFTETFGYERDDIPARFFLRDLAPALPPQGVWRRYDAGRVRLLRPCFELDLPAGTVVEFAYSEALIHGRVSPWITLSGGDSCNLDHYIARGGRQEFCPLTPRGGRFLEIHIFAPAAQVKFHRESVIERAYYGAAAGSLATGDALLDHLWSVGVESHRACAEDAITDNPTRERGQWAGDVVTVGMDVAASAFADLRLCRRSLVQCAQCARDDGLVAGLCPGGLGYLTTYAAQWVSACVHYWELTGERALLEQMWPYAERNLAAFAAAWIADAGLKDDFGWGFVDWGYVRNPGPSDIGVNLHYLTALHSGARWADALGHADRAAAHRAQAKIVHALIARYFETELAAAGDAWTRIGYHRAALGLRLGFFTGARADEGRAFLQAHMLRCFPNRIDAPRLSDPAANSSQLITPYFGHFSLSALIEHGGMDFVLGQYRTCWGWSLGEGRTTLLEVFDTRWSHSHQWGGCPTWQLSRYLLGLAPRHDLGAMHFDLSLATGSHPQATGTRPLPNRDEAITISWKKDSTHLHYTLETPVPLTLHLTPALGGGTVQVDRTYTAAFLLAQTR